MSDRFVTIASYAWTPEAQMAKNVLEAEGILAFLAGEMTSDALTGFVGQAAEVQLQVHEKDAARAAALLASVSAETSLDEDWESQAERGLCLCSLCGTAIPLEEGACPACGTANERITTARHDTRPGPARRADAEMVKKSDQVQPQPPRPKLASAAPGPDTGVPPARKGCALFLALPLLPLWLLWR